MKGIGARSVTAVVLFVGAAFALWRIGNVRVDYWEQLSPWIAFLAGAFAVLAGTFVFQFWRLGERSEFYFRFGERLPFAGETSLGARRSLIVGHAPQVEVKDFPPFVQRVLYVAIFSCIALITLSNRSIALLREVPARIDRPSKDYCAELEAAKAQEKVPDASCRLVMRAYKLGYTKDLGSCAADASEQPIEIRDVCHKRQQDEPYLHYAWRLLEKRANDITAGNGPGMIERLGYQLDHLAAMFYAMRDSLAMQPRSSHHLFVNLPDPRPSVRDRVKAALDRGACGTRLQHLTHFPRMEEGPAGPSKLLEQVLAQLLFNPRYQPVVAECKEVTVHWNAPADACAQLAANPNEFLAKADVLDKVNAVLAWRERKAELARIGMKRTPGELATPQRIVSLQCISFGESESALVEHSIELAGQKLVVREVRTTTLSADGASQIRLYKRLAELFAESFGYGRLTSNQAIGARPEEAAIAASFREPTLLLTRLELLRDADLFLGNDWLAKRSDILDVYPFHLHLQTFVEIFRRQYRLHRGRL